MELHKGIKKVVTRVLSPQSVWLILIMMFLAPFCGWVFQCGCTYVGLGGADHCNIYDASQPDCPWCVIPAHCAACKNYPTVFQLIPGIFIYLSVFLTIKTVNRKKGKNYLRDIIIGIIPFFVSSILIAWVYKTIVDYPFFIF